MAFLIIRKRKIVKRKERGGNKRKKGMYREIECDGKSRVVEKDLSMKHHYILYIHIEHFLCLGGRINSIFSLTLSNEQ